ncbi:MAG: hypothetical protein M0Q91_14485 [Methanoregula sp.]|jgi:uncharacterized membrane protein YqjE|nr:hypothetical protein [Methanoregula sp.]
MIVIGERKELRGIRLAEQKRIERKANILSGILVACMLVCIVLLILLVGKAIYLTILYPIDTLIALAWFGGFLVALWVLINYVFADAIAYVIARIMAPYFAKQVIEGMSENE